MQSAKCLSCQIPSICYFIMRYSSRRHDQKVKRKADLIADGIGV